MRIKSSTQLKTLVRNRSEGSSVKSQIIIRAYIMERFLERMSLSSYKDNIIIKGGALIAAIAGINERSTMDIDSTIKNIALDEKMIYEIVCEIIGITIDDNVKFEIIYIQTIMEDLDYPGIRVSLMSELDKMKTPLKLDFSTGDQITPREINFEYPLMFENRSIPIMAYNIESILAEKLETVISRGTLNSRMRDFYDIHILLKLEIEVNSKQLVQAIENTFKKRETTSFVEEWILIIDEVQKDEPMHELWTAYQKRFDYAKNITWLEVMESIKKLIESCK